MLSADELAKANEVCQWTTALYEKQGWNVLYTVQMPSGDMYDYIDVSGMPDPQAQPPPPPDMTLPPGVVLLLSELDMYPELRGPAGTQLRVRPDFPLYISGNTGATSVDAFIKTYLVPGTPTGGGRRYAGIGSVSPNLGASAWVVPYILAIEPGTMSLMEMAVGCRNGASGELEEMVGMAASTDYRNSRFANFGDSALRLQVEFMTVGETLTGEGHGGWAGTTTISDFHPYPSADNKVAPGMYLIASLPGGVPYASQFWIRFWNKRWWIGLDGEWIGWYDATIFPGGFDSGACEALWYGEAHNPGYDLELKKAAPKWPRMGSGQFANAGWGLGAAAFVNPTYIDMSEVSQWPDKNGMVSKDLYNPNCYTSSGLISAMLPLQPDRTLFVGGPGGDAPNDACPSPQTPPQP